MGHEAMEHGSMKEGHAMMMMSMTFHGGCNEVILFDFWKISTIGGLIGSMVGCFLLGILYEGLKFYREFLMARGFSSVPYNNVAVSAESSEREGDEASVVSSSPNSRPRSSVRVFRERRRRGFRCVVVAQLSSKKQRPSAPNKPLFESARLPDLPPPDLPHSLLLPHAHRHDLQLLALWLRGGRSCCWIFPFWLEENSDDGS